MRHHFVDLAVKLRTVTNAQMDIATIVSMHIFVVLAKRFYVKDATSCLARTLDGVKVAKRNTVPNADRLNGAIGARIVGARNVQK